MSGFRKSISTLTAPKPCSDQRMQVACNTWLPVAKSQLAIHVEACQKSFDASTDKLSSYGKGLVCTQPSPGISHLGSLKPPPLPEVAFFQVEFSCWPAFALERDMASVKSAQNGLFPAGTGDLEFVPGGMVPLGLGRRLTPVTEA